MSNGNDPRRSVPRLKKPKSEQVQGPGRKHDVEKPDWTLFPFDAAEAAVRVLEYGVVKYGRNNWQQVDDGRRRYLSAAQRHLASAIQGEELDQDSGLSHATHLASNALFLIWLEQQDNQRREMVHAESAHRSQERMDVTFNDE